MILKLKHHFEAAHRLSNYIGKCKNLHGHRWELEIEIDGDMDKETGMIIDFGLIKKLIDNRYDHAVILMNNPENEPLMKVLSSMDLKREIINAEPTAEKLVSEIYYLLYGAFYEEITKLKVKLWESPGACIEFDGNVY